MNVEPFLWAFADWARLQADIKAVGLVGSFARGAAEDSSDIDLMILTTTVERYFQDQTWIVRFGKVNTSGEEDWGRVKTLRVYYAQLPELEYNFATPDWASVPVDEGTHHVVSDGMKILHDPDGILQVLQRAVTVVRE